MISSTSTPRKKSSRRGRPRKTAIAKLKVMAWFNAVAQASGKTPAELEREFADPNHIRRSKDKNKEIRPNLWSKYRRGEVEPRTLPAKGKSQSIVQAVEAKYPGTAKVLALPLWRLLDFNQPVSMAELDAIQKGISHLACQLDGEEDGLVTGLLEMGRMEEASQLPCSSHIGGVIDRWTLAAVHLRKTMLSQQNLLIEQVHTSLEPTKSPRRKQRKARTADGLTWQLVDQR